MAAAQRPSLAPRAGAVCVRQVRAIWHDRRSTVQRAWALFGRCAWMRARSRGTTHPSYGYRTRIGRSSTSRCPTAGLPTLPCSTTARLGRVLLPLTYRSRGRSIAAARTEFYVAPSAAPALRASIALTSRAHSVWRLRPLWPPPPSRGRFAAVTTSGGAAAGPRTAGIDGARLRGPGAPPESPPPWMCPPQPMTAW